MTTLATERLVSIEDIVTVGEVEETYQVTRQGIKKALDKGRIFSRRSGAARLMYRSDVERLWKRRDNTP